MQLVVVVVGVIAYLEMDIFIFKSRKLLINKPRGGGGNGGGIIIDRSYGKQGMYFVLYRIKYERTVLYCGGAEIATGVPNSASSFGILSLHRLTLAVVGRVVVVVDDDDDVDDGSAKRIRRRSEKKYNDHTLYLKIKLPFDCGTFDAVDVSKNQNNERKFK
jgi:hypothetical protein